MQAVPEIESPPVGGEKLVLAYVVDASTSSEDSVAGFKYVSVTPHDIPEYPVADVHHCGPINVLPFTFILRHGGEGHLVVEL